METKARLKRRTFHVPNPMLISKIYCSCSLALDSAHEKFNVWTGLRFISNTIYTETLTIVHKNDIRDL